MSEAERGRLPEYGSYEDPTGPSVSAIGRRSLRERVGAPAYRPGVPETWTGWATTMAWMVALCLTAFIVGSLLAGSVAGQVAGWVALAVGAVIGSARSRRAGSLKRSRQ